MFKQNASDFVKKMIIVKYYFTILSLIFYLKN